MAGNLVAGKLRTRARRDRLEFGWAGPEDDADIRRLLRENPMPGKIALTLEREPDFFADAEVPGETKRTLVARLGGRVVCVGGCSFRQRFVNGTPRRVGYLGGLRLAAEAAGRFDVLRRGFEFFERMAADETADVYFTSIAADNLRARRFLERGLGGMPRYEFVGEYVTVVLPVVGARPRAGLEERRPSVEEWVELLNRHNREAQLAPYWTVEGLSGLRPLGLAPKDFVAVSDAGALAGGGALWDQRSFKQAVIRSYSPALARWRGLWNGLGRWIGQTRLPAVGESLAQAFAFQLVAPSHDGASVARLLNRLRQSAAARGLEFVVAGFAEGDARLTEVRRHFRRREYRSRLYVVRWSQSGPSRDELDRRVLAPEVALL